MAKLQGVDIDTLPEDYRGVARTLANGGDASLRQPMMTGTVARIVGEI